MISCKHHTRVMPRQFCGLKLTAMTSEIQLKLLIVASVSLIPLFALICCPAAAAVAAAEAGETHDNTINVDDNYHHHQRHPTPHHHHHRHKEHLHDSSHRHHHHDHIFHRHHQERQQLVASNNRLEPTTADRHRDRHRDRLQRRRARRHHHQSHQSHQCCPDRRGHEPQRRDDMLSVAPARETLLRRALSVDRFKLTKRETLDMVVNRLHILESLDEQLRAFTEAASLAQQNQLSHQYRASRQHQDDRNNSGDGQLDSQDKQIYCRLQLAPSLVSSGSLELPSGADLDVVSPLTSQAGQRHSYHSTGSCLRNKNLLNQVPPYMLNLYRQLLYELHEQQQQQQQRQQNSLSSSNFSSAGVATATATAAVQLISTIMPYKAQIMRSFRQPKIYLSSGLSVASPGSRAGAHSPYSSDIPNSTPTSNYIEGQSNSPLRHEVRRQPADDDDSDADGAQEARDQDESVLGNVVVELSVLPDQEPARSPPASHEIDQHGHYTHWRPAPPSTATDNLVEASGQPTDGQEVNRDRSEPKDRFGPKSKLLANSDNNDNNNKSQSRGAGPAMACSLKQRLLPAHKRDELCFWFNLGDNFHSATLADNDTLEFGIGAAMNGDRNSVNGQRRQERLVEAELHVFKLFPQLLPSEQVAQASTKTSANNRTATANSAANLYHLKTNLLEVNLYQILPRRRTTTSAAPRNSSSGADGIGKQQQPQKRCRRADDGDREPERANSGGLEASDQVDQDGGEYPLRLLDIRRIDLNSNGWETFYVKRAVEDWLRDARLNLGLVIKAKSMFDEPIKIGLIRFADAYDHRAYYRTSTSTNTSQFGANSPDHIRSGRPPGFASRSTGQSETPASEDERRHIKAMHDFDTSHQPLLVIYTNAIQIEPSQDDGGTRS